MIEIGLLKKLQEVWLWFTLNFGNYTQKSLLIKILYSTNSVKWQLNFTYRHFCHLHLSSSVQNNSVQKSNIYLNINIHVWIGWEALVIIVCFQVYWQMQHGNIYYMGRRCLLILSFYTLQIFRWGKWYK